MSDSREKLLISFDREIYNCFLLSYCGGRLVSNKLTRVRILESLVCSGFSEHKVIMFDKLGYPLVMEDLYNMFLSKLESHLDYLLSNPDCVLYEYIGLDCGYSPNQEDFVFSMLNAKGEFNLNPGDCTAVSKLLLNPKNPIGKLSSYDFTDKINKCFTIYANRI